jgi:hypothetical protein
MFIIPLTSRAAFLRARQSNEEGEAQYLVDNKKNSKQL